MTSLRGSLRRRDRRRASGGVVTVVSGLFAMLLAVGPAPARAELGQLGWSGTSFFCGNITLCEVLGTACDATTPGGFAAFCEKFPNGIHACSSYDGGIGEVLCCNADSDCGVADGVPGSCRSIGGGINVCVYPDLLDYCAGDAVTDLDVLACVHVSPTGEGPVDFGDGDCDDDGVPNIEDVCPCDAFDECFDFPDAGVPGDDAGVPEDDAGVPPFDGGVTLPDAGPPSDDAGPPPPGVDAGPPPPMDAGVDHSGVSFTGDGGCTVAPSGAGSPAWLLVLAVAALVRRRRRR